MIGEGAHLGYIVAAYAVTAVVIAAMVALIVRDGHIQRRRLAELEARGIRRRSAAREPAKEKA